MCGRTWFWRGAEPRARRRVYRWTDPSFYPGGCFWAVLGAYYLDQGFEAAQEYLLRFMQQEIDSVCEGQFLWGDYKSRFQELVQGKTDPVNIRYETIGFKGPEHDRIFQAGVFLDDQQLGTGEGRTKKEAEQQAAKVAIATLQAAAPNK